MRNELHHSLHTFSDPTEILEKVMQNAHVGVILVPPAKLARIPTHPCHIPAPPFPRLAHSYVAPRCGEGPRALHVGAPWPTRASTNEPTFNGANRDELAHSIFSCILRVVV